MCISVSFQKLYIKFLFILIFISNILFAEELFIIYRGLGGKGHRLSLFEVEVISNIVEIYNVKEHKNLIMRFVVTKNNSDLIKLIDDPLKQNNICAIKTLSINKSRKNDYLFSPPYLINACVIVTNKPNLSLNPSLVIGYDIEYINDGFHPEKYAKTIQEYIKSSPMFFKKYSKRITSLNELRSNHIDGCIVDLHESYSADLYILKILESDIDNLGIMFPQNSEIYKKLLPYMNYYLKSEKYYFLVKKYFPRIKNNLTSD